MSSILTNNGAMVALQSLRMTNANLAETQSQISTGKKVATAKDNAAIWAISKTMETDVSSFKTISDSLGVAEATVGVAMAGAERVTDLLNDMKELAAGAMTDGTDFAKIQDQIEKKQAEIDSVIEGSQMNGINLLKTDVDGNGMTQFQALASLDRTNGTFTTTANTITINTADLEASMHSTNSTTTEITGVASAETALGEIEGLIDTAIKAAAALGSVAKNIEGQREYVDKMSDALKSGIGSLVDANMEEASARLQALQTQQQLGTQSLSIANQAPQSILSLFR